MELFSGLLVGAALFLIVQSACSKIEGKLSANKVSAEQSVHLYKEIDQANGVACYNRGGHELFCFTKKELEK